MENFALRLEAAETAVMSATTLTYALGFALLQQPQIDRAKLLADIEAHTRSLPHIDATAAAAFLRALRDRAPTAPPPPTLP